MLPWAQPRDDLSSFRLSQERDPSSLENAQGK